MAIRVYKIAVVGCPRLVISPDGFLDGVGKSCLCNRFVRSEAYSEDHQHDSSELSRSEWNENPVFNGDHFVYWGAANKHLPDKTRVRFQVVEQTEFYRAPATGSVGSSSEDDDEELGGRRSRNRRSRRRRERDRNETNPDQDGRLSPHLAEEDYIPRASATHFRSRNAGKMAYRLKAVDAAVRRASGPVRAATQLFPNEDFGAKKGMGIYGFVCVFDPTLEGDHMERQLSFLSRLLPVLAKTKRKVVIACVKCDAVENHAIRFGSKLSSYALKKTVPFFEVSARDSVNVNEVFFSLVSAPKKSKNGHNSNGSSSGYPGYRDVMDSRKGDLNRAKDAFRKFLQLSVTDFSSTWNDMLPLFKMDRSYQSIKQIAGGEADEVLLKLFQLRLIEIKLMEAGKQYGDSLVKKADKEQSKQYQVYLKEAFGGHPDLRADSYKDYLPNLSSSEDGDSTIVTEPSTPSSCCPTPEVIDIHHAHHLASRLRSATLSELPELEAPDHPLSLNKSLDDITATLPPSKWRRHNPISPINPGEELTPPPLPARRISDALSSAGEKRLSCSTDCLFSPQQLQPETTLNNNGRGISYDRLDAEPYLQPQEVKIMLEQAPLVAAAPAASGPAKAAEDQHKDRRNNLAFLSMRVPKKKLRNMVSKDSMLDEKAPPKKGKEKKTHKRSQSNPFVLESMVAAAAASSSSSGAPPPPLPPHRKLDVSGGSPHTTPSHTSSKHGSAAVASPIESSLEFGGSSSNHTSSSSSSSSSSRPVSDMPLPPPLADMPLPPLPTHSSPKSVRVRLPTSKSVENDDLDNISQTSGPFEEIDNTETDYRKSSLPTPKLGLARGATLPAMPTSAHTVASSGGDSESDGDDQYAEIADFQQYMMMASAPVDKSKTLPVANCSGGEGVGSSEAVAPPPSKRQSTSAVPIATKRESGGSTSSSSSSAPLISTLLKKKLKKSVVSAASFREIKGGNSPPPPPPPPHHASATPKNNNISVMRSATMPKQSPSHAHDFSRPLPPSPTKAPSGSSSGGAVIRKISSGSNIYEVIDEEFIHRVRNRPSRQNSQREAVTDYLPQVDRSLWPQYLEAVRQFFSLPQIQEQWVESVKSTMKNVDPEDVFPPYFKVYSSPEAHPSLAAIIKEEEEVVKEEEEEAAAAAEEEKDTIAPLNERGVPRKRPIVHAPPPPPPPSSSSSSQAAHLAAPSVSKPLRSPVLDRILRHQHQQQQQQQQRLKTSSPIASPSLPRRRDPLLHGSNDLILLMNQCQDYHSDSSEDSDEDVQEDEDEPEGGFDSDESSDSDVDLDAALHTSREHILDDLLKQSEVVSSSSSAKSLDSSPQRDRAKPPVKPKPRLPSIPQTDLDAAIELRASSESNDSDLVSTDSALTKSPPHSNHSTREFDLEKMAAGRGDSEGPEERGQGERGEEGVEVVHNVRPSEFLKKKARYRLRSRDGSEDGSVSGGDRGRVDSGTSTPTF